MKLTVSPGLRARFRQWLPMGAKPLATLFLLWLAKGTWASPKPL